MKKKILCIIGLMLALVSVLASCNDISNSNAKAYEEKLDTWVSLLNYEGVSKEERESTAFKNKIKDLHEELGISFDSRVKNIPMDVLREYILTNDVDRILVAAENADFYQYYEARWVIFETIYDLYPEKFQKVVLDETATSGYYIDNPTASPGVTREEDSSNRPGYTNSYKVTHYGDYAVLEETYWIYDEGQLGWVNGVFYDTPAQWKTKTTVTVYYKGYYFDLVTKFLSDIEGTMFYETDTYIYKFYYYKGHLSDAGACKKVTD